MWPLRGVLLFLRKPGWWIRPILGMSLTLAAGATSRSSDDRGDDRPDPAPIERVALNDEQRPPGCQGRTGPCNKSNLVLTNIDTRRILGIAAVICLPRRNWLKRLDAAFLQYVQICLQLRLLRPLLKKH